ncbi:MAG: TIGR01440 family protein [Bacillota bacterium]
MELTQIASQIREAINGLLNVAKLKPKNIIVIGCSTSEIVGEKIGTSSNLELASTILLETLPIIKANNLFIAIQCCEHLNRALVVEEECADEYNLELVTVVPHEKAGGALAAAAVALFYNPVVVENISAHAGIDIGDTFIGMHLKPVAVPVRLNINSIGKAHLTVARTRPKLIGGERARYTKSL